MYPAVLLVVFSVIIWGMGSSIMNLIHFQYARTLAFSIHHFMMLIIVYFVLIVGFASIYIGLESVGIHSVTILDRSQQSNHCPSLYDVGNTLYFSAMTILTVGYGDMTPLGVGKLIASIQATIGYILPAAFLASGFISKEI